MTWRIDFRPSAKVELLKLDRTTQERGLRNLHRPAADPRNAAGVKALKGSGQSRLRLGDRCVIYTLDDEVLVVRIAHRREVYR